MIEIVEVLFEFVIELLFSLPGGRRRKKSERPSFQERLRRAKQKRVNRAIRRYLRRGDERRPIPGIGLTCRQCGYSLTGLTSHACPECGRRFELDDFILESGQ